MIPLTLRQCILGEIYKEKVNECFECPPGSYSHNLQDKACKACPESTLCEGGTKLNVMKGYWKSSNTSL